MANFPRFAMRRGAVADKNTAKYHLPNYVMQNNNLNSSYSDVSQMQQSLDSFASSRLSIQDLRELQSVVKNQRRKTRKERERTMKAHKHALLSRMMRRGSDTSTQSLAEAVGARSATNNMSTSTGDLQRQTLPFQSPLMPPLGLQSPSVMSPTAIVPIPAQQRVRKPANAPDITFSHGMSEHSTSLQNPLLEKRPPNSRIPYHMPSAVQQPPQPPQPQQASPFMPMTQFFQPPLISPLQFPYGINPYATPMLPNFHNFTLTQPQPQPQTQPKYAYNPTVSHSPPNTYTKREELRKQLQAQLDHLDLIAAVDSGSDLDNVLPIVMSDSDGGALRNS